MDGTHPLYRRSKPTPFEGETASNTTHIDLSPVHLPSYGKFHTVNEAVRLFDARAAVAVRAAVDPHAKGGVRIRPYVVWKPIEIGPSTVHLPFHVDDQDNVSDTPAEHLFSDRDLLEMKFYGDAAPTILIPRAKCLAALAYPDFFQTYRQIAYDQWYPKRSWRQIQDGAEPLDRVLPKLTY